MTERTMRERKKEATKTNILQVAIELINKQGFADTTMQSIAEKADVALRTLYNYFPSKESIVATYIQMAVQNELDEGWNDLMQLDTTYERLEFMCQRSAEWIEQNSVLIEVYASDPRNYYYGPTMDEIPRSGYDEIVAKVMEMGQKMGDISDSVSADLLARQFMGFYYFSILTWLGKPGEDLGKIFKEGLDLLYHGIKPDRVDAGTVLWGMFC